MKVIAWNGVSIDAAVAVSAQRVTMDDPAWPAFDGVPLDIFALHGARISLEGSSTFVPRAAPAPDWGPPPDTDALCQHYMPSDVLGRFDRWKVVVDSRGRVRWGCKEGGAAHLMLAVSRATPAGYLAYLQQERIPYLVVGEDQVDLQLLLRTVEDRLGEQVAIADGGGIFNGLLLRLGLVEEIDVRYLPFVIGQADAPRLLEGYRMGTGSALRLKTISVEALADGSIFARYQVGG